MSCSMPFNTSIEMTTIYNGEVWDNVCGMEQAGVYSSFWTCICIIIMCLLINIISMCR